MANEPITGLNGKVYIGGVEAAHARNGTYTPTSDVKTYRSSGTVSGGKNWQKTLEGGASWTLDFDMFAPEGGFSSSALGLGIGDLVLLKLESTTGKYVEGYVRIASAPVAINIEGVEPIGVSIRGIGDGAPTVV